MVPPPPEVEKLARRSFAWTHRRASLQARAYAAHQRELAAEGRTEGARVRDLAARIRADAARVRDEGARARDDAARVRDDGARVRDLASHARSRAMATRAESVRRRLEGANLLDRHAWAEIFRLDQLAAEQTAEALTRDREAAEIDRLAAEKDREAAEKDREAAGKDREAADKDREAAEKDRYAADADRAAADSDRKETERDLDIAEEHLSRADRLSSLGRLAGIIAHELNNPLAALQATLDALKRDLGAGASGSLLADAQVSVDRIAHVVAEVRATVHGSDARPARQLVDVPRLVEDALRLTRLKLERHARVVVDVQPLPELWGVTAQLGIVLTNLLLNAARAVESAGGPHEVRVAAFARGRTICLEVTDDGPGIAPEVLPHVFDPFFTTHEASDGLGLGLALCQRIVTEHGGQLKVTSTPGAGATFTIELPSGSASSLSVGDALAPEPGRKARVLLIDDDERFRRSLSHLLAHRCDVTQAVNGQEGLEALLAPGPGFDLVLCDLSMPVMNGLELYRRLEAEAPALASQLVFISGGATTQETAAFLAGLPNVQLQKPFASERLFELIDERVPLAPR